MTARLAKVFDRWKYAEEYANERSAQDGMYVALLYTGDQTHEDEDGETYTSDRYEVWESDKPMTVVDDE